MTIIIIFFIFLFSINLFAQIGTVETDTTEMEYVKFYHSDGQISSEGYFKDGKPNGFWKTYYEDGSLKSEGNRENFLLTGQWKFYNDESVITHIINYRQGKKHGRRITYIPDSTYVVELFENDIKQGLTVHYCADHKKRTETPFENGLQEGLGKEYDENGNIITLFTYRKGYLIEREKINRFNEKKEKHGIWKTFYPDNVVKTVAEYRHGVLNGFYKEFDEKGNLLNIVKYVNGEIQYDAEETIQHDIRYSYYSDGKIKIAGSYLNDVPHGIRREYSEEGEIEKSYIFRQGKLIAEGIVDEKGLRQEHWKEYYEDRRLKEEGCYLNSNRVGEWKYYYPNQKIEQIGLFNNRGQQHGEWQWYNENNQLWKVEKFDNGSRIGLYVEYDDNGNEIFKGKYEDGDEHGYWFSQINNIREEGKYIYGERTGTWKIKNVEKNILLYEGDYLDGFPDGKHKYYWDDGTRKLDANYIMGNRQGEWVYYDQSGLIFLRVGYRNGIEVKYERVLIEPQLDD